MEYQLYINGEWKDTVTGYVAEDKNPADDSVFARVHFEMCIRDRYCSVCAFRKGPAAVMVRGLRPAASGKRLCQ